MVTGQNVISPATNDLLSWGEFTKTTTIETRFAYLDILGVSNTLKKILLAKWSQISESYGYEMFYLLTEITCSHFSLKSKWIFLCEVTRAVALQTGLVWGVVCCVTRMLTPVITGAFGKFWEWCQWKLICDQWAMRWLCKRSTLLIFLSFFAQAVQLTCLEEHYSTQSVQTVASSLLWLCRSFPKFEKYFFWFILGFRPKNRKLVLHVKS